MTLFRSSNASMLAADITLLLVAAIWGGGFIAAKEALTTMTPFGILSTRFLLSSAVMLVLFFPTVRACTKKDIQFGILLGIIQYISFRISLNDRRKTIIPSNSLCHFRSLFFLDSYAKGYPQTRCYLCPPSFYRLRALVPAFRKLHPQYRRYAFSRLCCRLCHTNRLCRQFR